MDITSCMIFRKQTLLNVFSAFPKTNRIQTILLSKIRPFCVRLEHGRSSNIDIRRASPMTRFATDENLTLVIGRGGFGFINFSFRWASVRYIGTGGTLVALVSPDHVLQTVPSNWHAQDRLDATLCGPLVAECLPPAVRGFCHVRLSCNVCPDVVCSILVGSGTARWHDTLLERSV